MFKYLKALWYMVTGRFTKAWEAMQSNQYVMAATYDKAIEKQQGRFQTVKEAVANLMSIKITKSEQIKELNAKVEKLGQIKAGAAAKAKELAQSLMQKYQSEGVPADQISDKIRQHPDYVRHMGAFNDASSSLNDAMTQIHTLEQDLETRSKQIATYQAELQGMQRQQMALREEKQGAIADTAIAQQMEAVNSVLAGIAEDSTDKDLDAVRQARKRAQAKAEISSSLAGNDAHLAEAEYLAYSQKTAANSEFDKLIGLDSGTKAAEEPAEQLKPAALPQ